MLEANRQHAALDGQDVAPAATDLLRQDVKLLAGTPYEVLARIGSGGMGTILEAEHRALGKRVVVKLLLPKYARDPRLVERLKREARILAQIASPHIVTVSDLGQTADGSSFIAMERLYGCTLGHELKTRRILPIVEAIHWTREVLAGLAAAHRAGVVHRDIKLANIFLCDATDHEPRRIKLLDFGIAKVLKDATVGMEPSRHHPTSEGTLLGSPRWLAPEQARGKQVDGRADIYAVGLLLYTLVAGRGPFSHIRDPIDAIAASLTSRPAPPSTYAPQEIPAALDDAIQQAIEQEPEHRFQSAEAFSAALESIVRGMQDATQLLPAGFVWQRVDAASARSLPRAVAPHEDTAPTLLRKAVEPSEPPHAGAGGGPAPVRDDTTAAESDVRLASKTGGASVGAFVALAAASMLFFSALFAMVIYLAGGP